MKKTLKYCKQAGRDLGYYFRNGKKHFLPGGYNSATSLIAFYRAMIDYRLEIEKLVNQVAEHELQNISLALLQTADRIDLEIQQDIDNLARVAGKFPTKTDKKPAVVYIGDGVEYCTEGDTDELVTATKKGCGETGISAILSKMANSDRAGTSSVPDKYEKITVRELYDQFMEWIPENYPKPKPTADDYRKSCKVLLALYGDSLVDDFGLRELLNVQAHLEKSGLNMSSCNNYLVRMRRVFNWGAERAIIHHKIASELEWVKPLESGRTKAPEPVPREAVPDDVVDATLPFMPQMISDMVQIQRETAMRPGELWIMRWCDIDTTDNEWVYEPQEFKEQRHVDYKAIGLTEKCKQILGRYKDTPADAIIFSQIRNTQEMGRTNLHQFKTHLFDRKKFADFVAKAAKKAGVPHWTPYQLRHSGATEI